MKSKEFILANLKQKLAIYLTQGSDKENKLVEHIRMLDWVVSDSHSTRDIMEILGDYHKKAEEKT